MELRSGWSVRCNRLLQCLILNLFLFAISGLINLSELLVSTTAFISTPFIFTVNIALEYILGFAGETLIVAIVSFELGEKYLDR